MEERKKHEIHWVNREDANFPERLKKLTGMPKKLYYIGNLPDPAKPSAAVVGARMSSPYGRCQAFKYARTMAEHGVQIISGMARGIDSEGHKGALDTDTPTFAVLGSGVDVVTDWAAGVREAYERGLIAEADLDRALRNQLRVKFRLGLFDPPRDVPPCDVIECPEHRALALDALDVRVLALD